MTFRNVLFWAHLTAGVTAGIVILTMSATGFLLMYERQLVEWSDRQYRSVVPQDGALRLSVEALLAKAAEQRPQQPPTGITLRARRICVRESGGLHFVGCGSISSTRSPLGSAILITQ